MDFEAIENKYHFKCRLELGGHFLEPSLCKNAAYTHDLAITLADHWWRFYPVQLITKCNISFKEYTSVSFGMGRDLIFKRASV